MKKNKKYLYLRLGLFIFIINFVCVIGYSTFSFAESRLNKREFLKFVSRAIDLLEKNYVEPVDAKKLMYGALSGMMQTLDEYSEFLDPEDFEDMEIEAEGEFAGIGVELTMKGDELTIISPIIDSPGEKAGLLPGDKIVKIDDVSTKNMSFDDAVKKIRGKPGTTVYLTVLRNDAFVKVKIKRALVHIKSIPEYNILKDKVGYIKLARFQESTTRELQVVLDELFLKGIEGLVLDLRNNPGGLLSAAVEVSDLFLPREQTIVSVKGRYLYQNYIYRAEKTYKYQEIPIVVLINKGSASASEILAGALKDNKRAFVIGENSFGKGSIQTMIPLSNCGLRVTTGRYFTPSGIMIDKVGIMPDIKVVNKVDKPKTLKEDRQLKEAIDSLI